MEKSNIDKRILWVIKILQEEINITIANTQGQWINDKDVLEEELSEHRLNYTDSNGFYTNQETELHEDRLNEEIRNLERVIEYYEARDVWEAYKIYFSNLEFKFTEREMHLIKQIVRKLAYDFHVILYINTHDEHYLDRSYIVVIPHLLESFVNGNNNIDEKKDKHNVAIHQSPYMQVLEWLVSELSITEENQDSFTKKQIIGKLNDSEKYIKQTFGVELSNNQIDMLATFVRRPQIGGYKK